MKPAIPFVTRGFSMDIRAARNNDNNIILQFRYQGGPYNSLDAPIVYGINRLPDQLRDTTSTFTMIAELRSNDRNEVEAYLDDCEPAFMLRVQNNAICGIAYLTEYKPITYHNLIYYLYNLGEMDIEPPIQVNKVNVSYESGTSILLNEYKYYLVSDPDELSFTNLCLNSDCMPEGTEVYFLVALQDVNPN